MDEELEKEEKSRGEGKVLEYLVLAALIAVVSGTVGYLGRALREGKEGAGFVRLPGEAAAQTAGEERAVAAEAEAVPAVRLWEGAVWRADKPEPGEEGVEWWHYPAEGEGFLGEAAAAGGEGWLEPSFRRVCLWKDAENRVHWQFGAEEASLDARQDEKAVLDWREEWLGQDERVRGEWAAETAGMDVRVRLDVRVECLEFAFGWSMDAPEAGTVSAKELWNRAEREWARSWKVRDDEIKAKRSGILGEIQALEEESARLAEEEQGLWEFGENGQRVLRAEADRRYLALAGELSRIESKEQPEAGDRRRAAVLAKEIASLAETAPLALNRAARKRAKEALEAKRGELQGGRALVSASGKENTARSQLRREGKMRVGARVEGVTRDE